MQLCILIPFWNLAYFSKNIKQNHRQINDLKHRIQFDDSIRCRFYCIALIKYMIVVKGLLDYTNLFSPNDCKKNAR